VIFKKLGVVCEEKEKYSLEKSRMPQNEQSTVLTAPESPLHHLANSYYANFFKNLKLIYDDERFFDVELHCEGNEKENNIIKAHRVVLSASSRYFEAMFGSEFNENKNKIVKFHSISYKILKNLVGFIYTGKIEITQTNVQELLAAADMLQLTEIVDGCSMYLCRELHASNALGILRFAEAHNCAELAESASSFINSHFPEVAEQDEILEISSQMFSRLISSEMIRVDSEFQVFAAAMRWIKHEISNRKRFVFDILANVRLSLVSVRLIETEIAQCRDMSLKIALRSILKDLTSRRGQLVPVTANPRLGAKKSIYVIGGSKRESASGWTNDCIFDSVIKYDIFRREWVDVAPMAVGRILPGVTVLNSKIFVVGGERGSQIFGNGEVYDPISNSWENLPPMMTSRCEFGLCALGGTLWAIGVL
jgi:actin-binding protein IPP